MQLLELTRGDWPNTPVMTSVHFIRVVGDEATHQYAPFGPDLPSWNLGSGASCSSQTLSADYDQATEVNAMKTITISVPDEMTSLGGGSVERLGDTMRRATAILWYRQGRISQGKAAEIAGMNRIQFLDALAEAKVEAIQVSK